jgi:hypothetical protein
MGSPSTLPPLRVKITREPFGDYFTLLYGENQSEELDPEETRAWFRERGADLYQVERALDDAWNFYESVFTIENPRAKPITHVPGVRDF